MSNNYLQKYNSLIESIKKTPKLFNRSKIYSSFFKYIKEDKLRQFPPEIQQIRNQKIKSKKQKQFIVKSLSDSIRQFNAEILLLEKNNKTIDRFILEIKIDVCKRFLEDYTSYIDTNYDNTSVLNISNDIGNFQYYPELTDSSFNQKIYNKKEFRINEAELIDMDKIQIKLKNGFRRSSMQKFVKNFISPLTPYNGILLYHGVGVGKTCAAIGIAENFRDFIYTNNKKIIVLTPSSTLIDNWQNEILNIDKEIKKHNENDILNRQCTNTRYISKLNNIPYDNRQKFKIMAKKLIKKYYEFMGYQKLANIIEKEIAKFILGKKYKEKAKIEYIRRRFSNTVIIMDEVHFTREGSSSGISSEKKSKKSEPNDKKVRPWLEMIARYANNTKFVLLSATPMYNISKEIIWILNLLLLNDKRAPIDGNTIFNKDGISLRVDVTDGDDPGKLAKKLLIEKSRGYISYVRSENPFTFPIKLNPDGPNTITPNSRFKLHNNQLMEKDENEFIDDGKFVVYNNKMSDWQYNEFKKVYNSQNNSFSIIPIEASNIFFPIKQGDIYVGETGKSAFDRCFLKNKDKYRIREDLKDMGNGHSFLHKTNIQTFSTKFASILNSITSCKGIVFIYSDYLWHGVRAMAKVLEANGFSRWTVNGINNLLENPGEDLFCSVHNKYKSTLRTGEECTPAKYILLDSNISTNELDELVKQARGETSFNNLRGEHIKVILGSSRIEQGISFKNVREIHILEPWHHLNQLKQAAGRAIRGFSHIALPKEERNVTLYIHISGLPQSEIDRDNQLELIDERIYRNAYNKKKHMSTIDRILKRNAIDCKLNKYANLFLQNFYSDYDVNPLQNIEITDSKGLKKFINIYDIDGTDTCDFDICNYSCITNNANNDKINSDTFEVFFAEDDINLVTDFIKQLFLDEYVLDEEQLLEYTNKKFPNIGESFIFKALDDLIKNKELIYDGYKKRGYIISRYNYYIFQPKDILDDNISIKYRYLPNYRYSKNFSINDIPATINTIKPKLKIKKQIKKKIPEESFLKSIPNYSLSIFDQKLRSLMAYVKFNYSDYSVQNIAMIPSQINIIQHLFLSDLEKNFSSNDRLKLLLYCLYIFKTIGVPTQIQDIHQIVLQAIYKNYFSENRFSYFITKYMWDNTEPIPNSPIVGLVFIEGSIIRLFNIDSNNTIVELGERQRNRFRHLFINDTHFSNISNLTGYNKHSGKKNIVFHLINKEDGSYKEVKNKDGSKQKKSERRGGVCGQATGAKKKHELVGLINLLLNKLGYTGAPKYSLPKSIPNKVKTLRNKGKSLCEEIEILLRHLEWTSGTLNKRFFYKMEERQYISKYSK